MIALRRAVVICEWILISLFALVSVFLLLDLPSAWQAQPCSMRPITPDCYPWGMTEGPMEGPSWSYASKQNYLVSGIYLLGVSLLALILMPWLPPGRRILALLAAIALLYAGGYLMPLVF
jgi:hypothetical protein